MPGVHLALTLPWRGDKVELALDLVAGSTDGAYYERGRQRPTNSAC